MRLVFSALCQPIITTVVGTLSLIGWRTQIQQTIGAANTAQEPRSRFSVREQDDELCNSGSRQWTGSINVTADRSMFFWYHESRNNPETAPVILWLSGGPGATGELGMFKEIGPCAVTPDGNSTRRRASTWTNVANVLFVDQPIGIGFSTIADRSSAAVTLHAGARDLHAFLAAFTAEPFPALAGREWHVAGESMGGHYVTAYAQYIAQRQREEAWGAAAVPECERLGAACRVAYEREVCALANRRCDETVGRVFWEGVKAGGWNPYDSRKKCTEPPLCSNLDGGPALTYLNQPWVQERLGFSNHSFELIDFDLNRRWEEDKSVFLPTTRELSWLLDETDIQVLFINGNNDIICNTPGQLRMLDEEPWKRQAWFRSQPLRDWYHGDGKVRRSSDAAGGCRSGQWKGDGRLSIFTVDEAGHMAPADQPEAVEALIGSWISDSWRKGWYSAGRDVY